LTAIFVGLFFVLALFFSPLAAMIPAYASAAALLYVACIMTRGLAEIEWQDITESAPAVVTALTMPLTIRSQMESASASSRTCSPRFLPADIRTSICRSLRSRPSSQSSSHSPARVEHDLFPKPVPAFQDHGRAICGA
jgi:hypothetical protein